MFRGRPSIAVYLTQNEYRYKEFKLQCYEKEIVSQVISVQHFYKGKGVLSVMSNILKQVTVKTGGELYYFNYPKDISPKTMLIGIDVCHSGPKSTVGFCASYNKELTQYYSHMIVQKRGQEIVQNKLVVALKDAVKVF